MNFVRTNTKSKQITKLKQVLRAGEEQEKNIPSNLKSASC